VIRAVTHDDGSDYQRVVYQPTQAVEPAPTDELTDMMRSVMTDGTGRSASSYGFDRPAAGKTGTTSNHRDAWFAGFTPQLATVVWVGLDQDTEAARKGAKLFLTGGESALPIWAEFMKDALVGYPPALFPPSPQLMDARIDRHTGRPASPSCPDSQTIIDKLQTGQETGSTSCEPDWPPSQSETVAD
jgi:membrane carboxypeptidase/penicillin-binding protein